MADFNISDFNNVGRSVIKGLNIDSDNNDKINAKEFQNLFNAMGNNVQALLVDTNKLNGKLDVSRMDDDEVQAAIQNFNNLPEDDKNAVLANVKSSLDAKIKQLDTRYAELREAKEDAQSDLTSAAFTSTVRLGLAEGDISEDKIVKYLNMYNEASKAMHKTIEDTTDALIEFGGKALFGSKLSLYAEDDIAIGNKFEQTLLSYDTRINALAAEMLLCSGDEQEDKRKQLVSIMGEAAKAAVQYEKDSREMINSVIMKTQIDTATFDVNKNRYLEHMPNAFANKIVEYAVADALLAAPKADDNTTGVSAPSGKQAKSNSPIYDLSGKQVEGPLTKGVYIQDGRKFTVD